jgi:hypothetical protein
MRSRRIAEELRTIRLPNDELRLSDQVYWSFRGDPVKHLRVFLDLSQHPQRGALPWDIEMLDWVRKVWEAAAAACPHADDVKYEAKRFEHLRNRLAGEMREDHRLQHIWLDEQQDWARPRTILRAMFGLLNAEQRTLQ